MTSSVTVNARLINTKEVHVRIKDKLTNEVFKDKVLQDGESENFNVFDNREIVISEIDKDR